MKKRIALIAWIALACLSLQGCLLAAAGAGAGGGYESERHDCSYHLPIRKDGAGGIKGQKPIDCR